MWRIERLQGHIIRLELNNIILDQIQFASFLMILGNSKSRGDPDMKDQHILKLSERNTVGCV